MKRALFAILTAALLPGVAYAQAPNGVLEYDTNSDGSISRAEFLASDIKRFGAIDANHDNRLTWEERVAWRAATGLPPMDPSARQRTGGTDADGDGFISREEYYFNIGTIFARYDANGDNKVAGSEIAPAVPSSRP